MDASRTGLNLHKCKCKCAFVMCIRTSALKAKGNNKDNYVSNRNLRKTKFETVPHMHTPVAVFAQLPPANLSSGSAQRVAGRPGHRPLPTAGRYSIKCCDQRLSVCLTVSSTCGASTLQPKWPCPCSSRWSRPFGQMILQIQSTSKSTTSTAVRIPIGTGENLIDKFREF